MYPIERKRVEITITHLGPYRSRNLPRMLNARAKIAVLMKKAREIALRFHPNSAIIGLNMTPIVFRAPALKKRIRKEAANTYQP